jgi:hypothetical protein
MSNERIQRRRVLPRPLGSIRLSFDAYAVDSLRFRWPFGGESGGGGRTARLAPPSRGKRLGLRHLCGAKSSCHDLR